MIKKLILIFSLSYFSLNNLFGLGEDQIGQLVHDPTSYITLGKQLEESKRQIEQFAKYAENVGSGKAKPDLFNDVAYYYQKCGGKRFSLPELGLPSIDLCAPGEQITKMYIKYYGDNYNVVETDTPQTMAVKQKKQKRYLSNLKAFTQAKSAQAMQSAEANDEMIAKHLEAMDKAKSSIEVQKLQLLVSIQQLEATHLTNELLAIMLHIESMRE